MMRSDSTAMEYTDAQKAQILSYAYANIADQFDWVCRHGEIEAFMEKHDIPSPDAKPQIVTRDMKILVVGDLRGRKNDYIKVAKEFGFTEKNFEFVDFNQIKTFDIAHLVGSNVYSDVICGPIPHKIKGLKGANSLISLLESADEKNYPKLIRATPEQRDSSLKLTISSFRKALPETKLVREIGAEA